MGQVKITNHPYNVETPLAYPSILKKEEVALQAQVIQMNNFINSPEFQKLPELEKDMVVHSMECKVKDLDYYKVRYALATVRESEDLQREAAKASTETADK